MSQEHKPLFILPHNGSFLSYTRQPIVREQIADWADLIQFDELNFHQDKVYFSQHIILSTSRDNNIISNQNYTTNNLHYLFL